MENPKIMLLLIEHEHGFEFETGDQAGIARNLASFTETHDQAVQSFIQRLTSQAAARPHPNAVAAQLFRELDAVPKLGEPLLSNLLLRVKRAVRPKLDREDPQAKGVIEASQGAHSLRFLGGRIRARRPVRHRCERGAGRPSP